ncbi:DUF5686 family protein [Flavobacterium sp.]|uniref:DUF5686 family protein n=1 Tax=Flavobacterium sp. TaxID=239 RepID=UPI00352901B8
MQKIFVFFLLLFTAFGFSQTTIKGQVIDLDTTIPIAFAEILYNGATTKTNWEGHFELQITSFEKPIIINHKGYYQKFAFAKKNSSFLVIKIVSNTSEEKETQYTENSVNKLIKQVIENKSKNNPKTALKSYEYKNYENIVVTANPDSVTTKIDTIIRKNIFGTTKTKIDSTNFKFQKFIAKQHIYQTEKVNLIQYDSKHEKETVLATRMAGFSEPIYEFLGLNLVSYSVYENPFEILEIPVQNPISKFGRILYNYHLLDTVSVNGRKAYRVYFQPKKLRANKLRGLLYIDAENYAICKAYYRIYGIMNIKANYSFNYNAQHNIWFPKQRDIKIQKGTNKHDIKILGETIEFNASMEEKINNNVSDQIYIHITSTPFNVILNENTTIKNQYVKINVPKNSFSKENEYWSTFEKDTTDYRKTKTYQSLDSLSIASKIEKRILFGRKIFNGYLPVSYIDLDLRSLIKYNGYEGFRLGLGFITNEKLSENYKIAMYGAYGLKDRAFKYGITPSYRLDKESETWLNASYTNDVSELAETYFATDSRRFKIYDPRPINITTFYNHRTSAMAITSKIISKTDAFFSLTHDQINPLFDYIFITSNKAYTSYNLTTAQVAFQWNPYSNYMKTPKGILEYEKRHPKFSLQLTQSIPGVLNSDFSFTKIDFKTFYLIPYLSGQKSAILLQSGFAFGNIPLTHLYSIAPNNINRNAILKRLTFAGKNSFETMYYNEFFSDKYVALHLKHTFTKIKIGYGISPEFSIATRMAWGDISNPEKHIGLPFKSLNDGFIESGIEANKIFKGLGLTAYYRYGANHLPRFDDNISLKITYYLDLGF